MVFAFIKVVEDVVKVVEIVVIFFYGGVVVFGVIELAVGVCYRIRIGRGDIG